MYIYIGRCAFSESVTGGSVDPLALAHLLSSAVFIIDFHKYYYLMKGVDNAHMIMPNLTYSHRRLLHSYKHSYQVVHAQCTH